MSNAVQQLGGGPKTSVADGTLRKRSEYSIVKSQGSCLLTSPFYRYAIAVR
jgi:hypothetical protein